MLSDDVLQEFASFVSKETKVKGNNSQEWLCYQQHRPPFPSQHLSSSHSLSVLATAVSLLLRKVPERWLSS